MSTTFTVMMGDRGRLVVPAALRARQRWSQGTPLLLVETEGGVLLATREQVEGVVRKQLAGTSLVDELIAERRAAAATEATEAIEAIEAIEATP